MEVGGVGTLDGDIFDPGVTTLTREGIPFSTKIDESTGTWDYTSTRGVEVVTKLKGETSDALPEIPRASAGIGFTFSRAGGVVLRLEGCIEPYIDNRGEVDKEILSRVRAFPRTWDVAWAYVSNVVIAESGTILVSMSENARVAISAEADVTLGPESLANASLGLRIVSKTNMAFSEVAAKGLTPLVKARGVHRGIFGSYDVRETFVIPESEAVELQPV